MTKFMSSAELAAVITKQDEAIDELHAELSLIGETIKQASTQRVLGEMVDNVALNELTDKRLKLLLNLRDAEAVRGDLEIKIRKVKAEEEAAHKETLGHEYDDLAFKRAELDADVERVASALEEKLNALSELDARQRKLAAALNIKVGNRNPERQVGDYLAWRLPQLRFPRPTVKGDLTENDYLAKPRLAPTPIIFNPMSDIERDHLAITDLLG